LVEGQRRRVPLYLIFAQPELAGPATRGLADVLRHAAKDYIPLEVSQGLSRQ